MHLLHTSQLSNRKTLAVSISVMLTVEDIINFISSYFYQCRYYLKVTDDVFGIILAILFFYFFVHCTIRLNSLSQLFSQCTHCFKLHLGNTINTLSTIRTKQSLHKPCAMYSDKCLRIP